MLRHPALKIRHSVRALANTVPTDEFVAWAMEDRPNRNHRVRPEQMGDLVGEMRSLVPKPGSDHSRIIMVRMTPDKTIRERLVTPHKHPEHVVLYYLLPTGPIEIEGELYQPELGEMLYMPPNVVHAVPEVKQMRISIALMVEQ